MSRKYYNLCIKYRTVRVNIRSGYDGSLSLIDYDWFIHRVKNKKYNI